MENTTIEKIDCVIIGADYMLAILPQFMLQGEFKACIILLV
ncbi:MAG: hypothetical protein R2801_04285 [Chitinophagales bacterium]